MKKSIFISLFIFLTTGLSLPSALGQQLFFGIDAGYDLKINSPYFSSLHDGNVDQDGTISTYENVCFSLGQGLQTGISAGYMFNKNMGVELSIAFQKGTPVKMHRNNSDSAGTSFSNMDYSFTAQSIRIAPALIMQARPDATFSPFVKTGLILSKASMVEIHEGDGTSGYFEKCQWDYTKGLNLGFLSSIGALYKLSAKLTLVGEIKIQWLNYAPGKKVISEYTIDGVDQLPGMTTSEIETEFVNPYSYDPHVSQPVTEPMKSLKEPYALNSYGFNIGLRFNL